MDINELTLVGPVAGIFWENDFNAMAADALAPGPGSWCHQVISNNDIEYVR